MTVVLKDTSDRLCVPQHGGINSEAGEWTERPDSFSSDSLAQ
jgi:hypothetical protein